MIMDLQRRCRNELAFLPRVAIDWYIENKLVAIAIDNGGWAGYALGRPAFRFRKLIRPLTHIALYPDARRKLHGTALLAAWTKRAADAGQLAIQATVNGKIESNHFFLDRDFAVITLTQSKKNPATPLIVYRRPTTSDVPRWIHFDPHHASE